MATSSAGIDSSATWVTNSTDWGMRSNQDEPDSDSWGGQSVFDVYSKSDGTALDGTKYSTW